MAYLFKEAHTHLKKNTEMENCCVKRDRELECGDEMMWEVG